MPGATIIHHGSSKSGLASHAVRDLDQMTPRPPLPKRALPDSVRAAIGLAKPAAADAGAAAGAARLPTTRDVARATPTLVRGSGAPRGAAASARRPSAAAAAAPADAGPSAAKRARRASAAGAGAPPSRK